MVTPFAQIDQIILYIVWRVFLKKDLYVYEKTMTDSLKLFNSSEFGEMRTYRDPNTGDVWFCLADVCKALDLMNPRKVKTTLTERGLILLNVRDLDNTVTNSYGIPTEEMRGNPNMTFIDEGNLYQVIFQSRKPNAAKFREWVCYEVLPSIRNHGVYMTTETIAEVLKNPDLIIGMATELKKEQEARKKLQETVNKNKPKVEYADAILESEGSILIKELALWLQKNGIKIGQLKLYEWMRENDYTYKEGEMKNLPKQKWIEKGYFTLKKSKYTKDNNVMTSTTAKITEKGQQYFIEKFRSHTA